MVSSEMPRQGVRPGARAALLLAGAVVVAVAVDVGIREVAIALGAPRDYGPLSLPALALFTTLGVIVGWVGWRIVQTRARHPRRTLAVLVPVVLLLSFVPDLLLLAFPVIPGTNTPAVLALMATHVVAAACAVPAYVLASRPA